jgi:nucleotide-binding universal stress UspA family protein
VLSIAPASVLLISETSPHKIEHMMVRMDFSKMSRIALESARFIQKHTAAKISCHHVYKLPLKYFPEQPPKKDQKLKKHVEKYTNKEFQKLIKPLNISPKEINCSSSIDVENEEANIVYTHALNIGADMILIGSKIKSELADIIVDTTSEKLAANDKNITVLVIKDRKQTMGFLEALFE